MLKAAMNGTFQGRSFILNPFINYVLSLADCDSRILFAKLFHLFQSSGTGKTKLCLELITKLGCGSYLVYRKDNGFPLPSLWSIELIMKLRRSSSDESAMRTWLAFILPQSQFSGDLMMLLCRTTLLLVSWSRTLTFRKILKKL